MAQVRVNEDGKVKSSFGVNAYVASPTMTGPVRNKENGEKKPNKQGNSVAYDADEDEMAATGVRATNAQNGEKAFHMQGSSRISQPPQVTCEDLDLAEDLAAIFEGTELSDEFKDRAVLVFETAVAEKVNEALASFHSDVQEEMEDALQEQAEGLVAKLDSYLDYVIEQWMEENKIAVEAGIKTEMSEAFMAGLRDLFSEHYVDIPEDKEDVLTDLAARIDELEKDQNELLEANVELNARLAAYERAEVFAEVAEGLTETQIDKLESLTESLNYTDPNEFRSKVEKLRENYFPGTVRALNEDNAFDEDPIENLDEENSGPKDPAMKAYVQAISRSIKK